MSDATGTLTSFRLERITDHSGVSGTGTVARGVIWPDGKVALWWPGHQLYDSSTAVWGSIEAVLAVHGHGRDTIAVFDDPIVSPPFNPRALDADRDR